MRCLRAGPAAGVPALWYPGPRIVTCRGCLPGEESVVEGTPGASARREYERRHARREDLTRKKLGVVGVALARVVDEPQSTKAWKTGAAGEERVGTRIAKLLADSDVKLLHDRRIPERGQANIDHLAVGPGGVTVIDTKNYHGKIRVEHVGGLFSERRVVLTVAGPRSDALGHRGERQLAAVSNLLSDLTEEEVDVRGALCFANADGLPLLRHQSLRGVFLDGSRAVSKLGRRPGRLSAEEIARLWQHLGRALPEAEVSWAPLS